MTASTNGIARARVSQPRINVNFQRTIVAFVLAIPLAAQPQNPVQWKLTPQTDRVPPGSPVILKLQAKVDQGWHLYSMTTPKGGAPATKIAVAENPAVIFTKFYQQKPESRLDPNFGVQTESYEHEAEFLIEAAVAANAASGPLELTAQLRYSVCSETQCLPQRKSVSTSLTIDPAVPKRGERLGQLFALICGAIGLAFVGAYFNAKRKRERDRERTPKEAADAAVDAALAASHAIPR